MRIKATLEVEYEVPDEAYVDLKDEREGLEREVFSVVDLAFMGTVEDDGEVGYLEMPLEVVRIVELEEL